MDAVVAPSASVEVFEGVDFANRKKRTGQCFVVDDGERLTFALHSSHHAGIKVWGVDCPFGTSWEFFNLLNGLVPTLPVDGSCESRATERWLRGIVRDDYLTPALWRNAGQGRSRPSPYFHPTTHIQPSVGLRIVPSCLYWLTSHPALPGSPSEKLKAARVGEGRVVEAHPRMFLYSMVERVHRSNPDSVTTAVLDAVGRYKDKGSVSNSGRRELVYRFLMSNPEWLGSEKRLLAPGVPDRAFFDSDHTFDAWLSALTAWAADKRQTIGWRSIKDLPADRIEVEGHIQVLDHAR